MDNLTSKYLTNIVPRRGNRTQPGVSTPGFRHQRIALKESRLEREYYISTRSCDEAFSHV